MLTTEFFVSFDFCGGTEILLEQLAANLKRVPCRVGPAAIKLSRPGQSRRSD